MIEAPPPKLWLPPKPAIIRAWRRGDLARPRATFPFPFFAPLVASGPSIVAFEGTTDWDAGTSIDAGLPAGYAAGDYLIMIVSAGSNNARTISTPSGFTSLYNAVGNGNLRRYCAFYKSASGSEGSTINVAASGVCNFTTLVVAVRGAIGAPEAGTAVVATSTSVNPPSLSPSWGSAPTLWFGAMHSISQNITGPTSDGWASTATQNPAGGGNVYDAVFSYLSATASSQDPPAGTLTSASNAANTIAIR